MAVEHFPGDFRIGALNAPMNGVIDSSADLLTPKFLVLLLLRGRQRFILDGQHIELIAGMEDDSAPVGFAVSLTEPAVLQFDGSWGDPFRKVSIAGPPDWFDQIVTDIASDEALPNFPQNHMEHVTWTPSSETVRLATQIILAPPEETEKQLGLFRMSRALEILRRIPEECASGSSGLAGRQKAHEDIRLFILQNLSSDLSFDRLEQEFGLNRRSIQRRFKQDYGLSVAEYIRKERLKHANNALQHDGVTIAQAAHQAGYSNTANFATAFRRTFGVSPTTVRNKAV